MKKRFLVTGGAGFIASALAKRLLKEGHEVVIVDNLRTGKEQNLPTSAHFIHGDIADTRTYDALGDFTFDAVYHLAAQSSGEISFESPEYDVLSNTLGTLKLLEFAVEQGIMRFIYASTMSIYGDHEKQPLKEDVSLKPKSYYGITKLAAEHYVKAFSDRLNTTSLRLFNVYGPGQNMDNLKQGMVSIYLAYFMKNEPVIVKGSPDRFRDFTYIDDVIEGFWSILDHSASYGKSYNLATGKKTTVASLLNALKKAWGDENYPITFAGNTPGDQFGTYADITNIQTEIGWKPRIELEEGIQEFIAWVKKH